MLHIVMGGVVFLYEPIAKLYFIGALVYFLWQVIMGPRRDTSYHVFLACSYFVGAEVFFRMTKGGLSYEASKYLVILFALIGMFYKGVSGKGYPYFMYLILLVPAIIVASITLTFDANFRTNVAFVLSGPACLGIASLFCYDRKVSHKQILDMLLYMLLPLVATTTYLFLYNPSIKDALSGTASNSAASGGFGPNQVATVLGLGMFIMVVRLFLQSPNLLLKLLNVGLLGAMGFRAIVTFSRGGIFAAIIVVGAFLWTLFFRSNLKQKNQIIGSFLLLVMGVSVTWVISSTQTLGLIDKRYANQDAQGREKEDVTTGRVDLFREEVDGFLESPFLGIGASRTKNKRVEETGHHLPSHNEVGRLLAEHGFFGVLVLIILIFTPIAYRGKHQNNLFFWAFLCFWFATINHSGMRIAAPSFIYALSLLNVRYEKRPVYRKQLKQQIQ
ncbi:O-antigen ligase [Mangrovimonas sp. TPBH4]|uniref:O-antigen ligase family protein n=1 Tax=Mangrovimonas sp. TPBH4 TaxID=1645914 RepID=UPI001E49D1F2|nr:O-antigen ligase family protein [Mangrovimonas sp. TPBH4]